MRREKVVIISSCDMCPHYNFDDGFHVARWGKHWCDKLDKDLGASADHIPSDCPLPDKQQKDDK